MERKKILVVILAAVILVSLLVGCSSPAPTPTATQTPTAKPSTAPSTSVAPSTTASPTAAVKALTAKISTGDPPASNRGLIIKKVAELTDQYTNGRLKIEVFTSAQLYKAGDDVDAVRNGYVEMCLSSVGALQDKVDNAFQLGQAPVFVNVDHMHRWMANAQGGQLLAQRMEAKGFTNIALVDAAAQMLCFTAKKSLKTLDDYKGLKMRSSGGVYLTLTKATGANPITIASADAFTALQQGTVDGGTFTGPSTFYTEKWYTVAPLSQNWPVMSFMSVLANPKWFNSLPQDIQQIIKTKVSPEVTAYSAKLIADQEGQALTNLKTQMKEINVISAAEAAKVSDTVVNGLDSKIRDGLADYLKAMEATKAK